jgi:signal transduction histidine kinase
VRVVYAHIVRQQNYIFYHPFVFNSDLWDFVTMEPFRSRQLSFETAAPYLFAGVFLVLSILISVIPTRGWLSGITSNYLSVHIVLEFIGILVSFGIFTVGWSTFKNTRDLDVLVLSIASLAIGTLDLFHTLTFTGMPDFLGPSGPNKAIYFWLASRSVGSLAFLYIGLSKWRVKTKSSTRLILLVCAVGWVALCFDMILLRPAALPFLFIPGQGLQPLKLLLEWSCVLVSSLACVLLFVRAESRASVNMRWMACACALYAMCGYFFTRYSDFDDLYNFTGHCFKAVSALVLYRAVFSECVSQPYRRLESLAAEASAASLSKSRFLANVSHEFRTPLGIIVGFSDLTLGSGKLDSTLSNYVQAVARNARHLSAMIDDLLDLAKAENERIEIRNSPFDARSTVEHVCESFVPSVQAKGVELHVVFDSPGSLMFTSDEMRLRQILMNVVGNAVKFTASGLISLHVNRSKNSELTIAVADSGIGIAEKDVSGLFQPFSQVSNPTGRKFGGTGLGLSLSRKLAELLGGTLRLESAELGIGSRFALTIPDRTNQTLIDKPSEKRELKLVSTAPPSLRDRRVLIAEDSKDNQLLLKAYLTPTEIEISFANNGQEAVRIAAENDFDLIIMDIQMPIMDGFEATLALRNVGWPGRIVALTAHALQPERDRAMSNGFNDYLIKPISKRDLWAAIQENLRVPLPAD